MAEVWSLSPSTRTRLYSLLEAGIAEFEEQLLSENGYQGLVQVFFNAVLDLYASGKLIFVDRFKPYDRQENVTGEVFFDGEFFYFEKALFDREICELHGITKTAILHLKQDLRKLDILKGYGFAHSKQEYSVDFYYKNKAENSYKISGYAIRRSFWENEPGGARFVE